MKKLETLDNIVLSIVEPAAEAVDREAIFPRSAIRALGEAGLLGLISSPEVGGLGGSLADASSVVSRLAQACTSTAMVVTMHYCAMAVFQKHGSSDLRHDIAAGR